MAQKDNEPLFRIIGVRPNGEQVDISAHYSREVAIRLIQNRRGYAEVRIEDPQRDGAVTSDHR